MHIPTIIQQKLTFTILINRIYLLFYDYCMQHITFDEEETETSNVESIINECIKWQAELINLTWMNKFLKPHLIVFTEWTMSLLIVTDFWIVILSNIWTNANKFSHFNDFYDPIFVLVAYMHTASLKSPEIFQYLR